ncbi:alpha/beta hydrolase [Leucobacter ruminantium]|uniref:Alpha/beta fold hydrolase n=1 Tax=Leucobacter ruminantium TaxID=1289170 RepID=A0A939LX17_9MICO|nr:alpha/beta hydrolase [Leucobacter ruminantium]MBO1806007.1 alpha/beta fold hydrolase [Leucobacter ruminantium]
MGKRILGAVAVLAAAALLSGCAATADDSESARQAEMFPGVYAQTIEWGECDEEFGLSEELEARIIELGVAADEYECAMVEAPLDWNDPGNRETIELATVHISATGEKEPIGTLLSNPGGPGASGLDLAYGLPTVQAFAPILEQYDMLGFDPRGIGRSTPAECEAVSGIDELNLAACADEHPIALSMGTSQVARDMELLRTLMGDDAMHYLGYSYGTMLGATYSTLFPEQVGRMVLDSSSAADWASPRASFDQSVAIAQQVGALVEGCGTQYEVSSCPMRSEADVVAALEKYTQEPMLASDGTEVTGETLYGFLVTSLYQGTVGRTLVLDTVGSAVAGGQEQIDIIAEAMREGGAAVSLDGAIVRCHSFPSDPDLIGFMEHVEEVGIPELLGGPEISDDTLRPYMDLSCGALPNSGDDVTDAFSGSPAPILVIGITGDHATPYEGSQELVRELGNAALLTLEGSGHGASFSDRSSCADAAATAYLLKGELPAEGTVCTDD